MQQKIQPRSRHGPHTIIFQNSGGGGGGAIQGPGPPPPRVVVTIYTCPMCIPRPPLYRTISFCSTAPPIGWCVCTTHECGLMGPQWVGFPCHWREHLPGATRLSNEGGGRYSPLARSPPPPKRVQLTGAPNPTETDPQALEVTRTGKSAKNANGICGISTSRGFRKVIICNILGERN